MLLLYGAVALMLPLALVLMMGVAKWAERHTRLALPPGESHDGRPLAARHPLQTWVAVADRQTANDEANPPLALREGCAWGQPGRNPYKGSTAQALRLARLPPEVVQQIVHMRETGAVTDRVEIRTGSIRAVKDQREFNPRSFAMTFGRTLCVDARVNFPAGHVERADLYEARDARGRMHAVMVPDVCGNVSVLGAVGERVGKRRLSTAMAAQGGPAPWTFANAPATADVGGTASVASAAGPSDGGAAAAAADDAGATGEAGAAAASGTGAADGGRGTGAAPAQWAANQTAQQVADRAASGALGGSSADRQVLPAANVPWRADGAALSPGVQGIARAPGDGGLPNQVLRVVSRFVTEGELPGGGMAQVSGAVNEVPEPGTLATVLGALAALALVQWRLRLRSQPLSRPSPSCRPSASSSSSGRRPSSSSSSSASAQTD